MANFIRDDVDLNGTKYGCDVALCRACERTIAVATPAMLNAVFAAAGKSVRQNIELTVSLSAGAPRRAPIVHLPASLGAGGRHRKQGVCS